MSKFGKCQISLAVAVCSAISTVLFAQPASPELKGPFEIGLQKFRTRDESRGRLVNHNLWYPVDPTDGNGEPIKYAMYSGGLVVESPFLGGFVEAAPSDKGPFPIIVLSHGNDAKWPDQFAMLAESLASHGFVVAAPRHTGDLRPESNENRPADISFVLDFLDKRSATEGDLINGLIDIDTIGMGGYSRGGRTILGNITGEGEGRVQVEPDTRVKAALFIDSGISSPNMEIPVLEVGTSRSRIWTSRHYSLQIDNTHHWSYGMQGCQFREKLIEEGRTEQQADRIINSPVDWLGCRENLRPVNEVQELMSKQAVAFFKQHLQGNNEYESLLEPDVNALSGNLSVLLRVFGSSLREGLDFAVTDPAGRVLGYDPLSGELVNDFGEQAEHRSPGSRSQQFDIAAEELIPGEYRLSGRVTESLTEPREFEVVLGYQSLRGDDVVGLRERLTSGTIFGGVSLDPLVLAAPIPMTEQLLQAGDADQDLDFDQLDLVQVQVAANYLSGEAATWGEGDWDGAPGGSPGDPPLGDGLFNQLDIVAAQQAGLYLTGSYAGVQADTFVAVPEPSGFLLTGIGILGVLACVRRRVRPAGHCRRIADGQLPAGAVRGRSTH